MYACSSAGNLKNYTAVVVDSRIRYEVLTPMNIMATVLWAVMPCSLVRYITHRQGVTSKNAWSQQLAIKVSVTFYENCLEYSYI
jgi:hypothetical protein